MTNNTSINESSEVIFKELEKFLRTETVVGEPITIGDVTIVSLVSVNFGFGMGQGTGNDKENGEGSGGGVGVGAKISPDAILVINKGEVTMMPIKSGANLDKLFDKIPQLLEKISIKKSSDITESKEKEEVLDTKE